MNGIRFVEPTQKMEFEQKEYLLANYDVANKLLDLYDIPWFSFDFTLQAGSTVWLQVLNFNIDTNTFDFVDYIQLDNTKLNSNYFEGYTNVNKLIGICRIVFKTVAEDVYQVSYNLLKYNTETLEPMDIVVVNSWITFDVVNVETYSPNKIKILNQDVTSWVGIGLKLNDIISHFIIDAVILGSDTILTLTGAGSVPLSIESFKYKRESVTDIRGYWWSSLNINTTDNILSLDINSNELFWSKPEMTIVYIGNWNKDKGSNPNNGTYNLEISGLKLASSDILLDSEFTNCGINLQNNIVKWHDNVELKTIIKTGSDDVGRGEVEIIAFS